MMMGDCEREFPFVDDSQGRESPITARFDALYESGNDTLFVSRHQMSLSYGRLVVLRSNDGFFPKRFLRLMLDRTMYPMVLSASLSFSGSWLTVLPLLMVMRLLKGFAQLDLPSVEISSGTNCLTSTIARISLLSREV